MATVYRYLDVCRFVAVDACSIQNVCASKTFINKSVSAGFEYNIPEYALYEAVYKPLKQPNEFIRKKRAFILEQVELGKIHLAKLTLEDLQEMLTLRDNKPNLGNGELACIVYSKNKPLAVLTDDKAARNYSKKILGENKAYETAEIVANMVYNHIITDAECMDIINEERLSNSNMDKPYLEAYNQALRGAMYEK
jgi:predicted nucleic acid-binding protein